MLEYTLSDSISITSEERRALDEERYREFLAQLVGPAGSLQGAFKAAHTLCGAMAGFLTHHQAGGKAGLEESIHPDRFSETGAYQEWLTTSTDELDALERERQKKSAPRKAWWKPWR